MDADGAPKRQRISLACLPCRKKRMRCDGAQPQCQNCTTKGLECEYQQGESKRKPPSKQYVESLHARINALEAQLAAVGKQVQAFNPPSDNGSSPGSDDRELELESDERDPVREVSGLLGRLNVTSDGQLHYFGSQSNYHLIRAQMGSVTARPWYDMQMQGVDIAAQLNKAVAIPIELRDHLLELYWTWQNPWNYIVHKPSFIKDLEAGYGRFCSPLLLLAVLALASRFSDRLDVRTETANPDTAGLDFLEGAKILLMYESETPTVTTVQAAALMSLRAMSDSKDSLGWLYSGNATRMAMNLGLNLDCSEWVSSGLISEEEAEVRKTAWWGCYNVDKLFSIALGRPGTTRKSHVTCPKTTNDQEAEFGPWPSDTTASLPGAHARIISTSHYVIECMTIAGEAMEDIYAPKSDLTEKSLENIITKADVAMNTFYNTLPSFLRLPSLAGVSTLPHIYLLHIQYHVGQILLHRPLVQKHLGRSTPTSESIDENPHMEACRKSACEIVKILRSYKRFYTLRHIPIATVHNTFTAAVLHLLDIKSVTTAYRGRAVEYFKVCVEALRDMKSAWCDWSSRASRALQLLAKEWLIFEHVSTIFAHLDPQSEDADQSNILDKAASLPGVNRPSAARPLDDSVQGLQGSSLDLFHGEIFFPRELDGIINGWMWDAPSLQHTEEPEIFPEQGT